MFSASKTAAPVSGGYQVSNSLRFRASASAYLNRTFGAGNQKTWTWSGWVKRGKLGDNYSIFSQGTGTSSNGYASLRFNSDDTLYFFGSPDGAVNSITWTTSGVFRDPSAWYHIVAVLDTTQATASNRFKLWVNGVLQAGSFGTIPTQNADIQINRALTHLIAAANAGGFGQWNDGYMAEVNFIDGQALTPSSFGSINATTGVWQPARYTGSYGTNGFYLKFNNGTSTTTLGNDSSGNGNNWTTNNISLTAGSTYDWMIDSPTSYAGSSYGVGNYAVLNPINTGNGTVTISGANLNVVLNTVSSLVAATIGAMSGKFYFETTITSSATAIATGFAQNGSNPSVNNAVYYYSNNGGIYLNNVLQTTASTFNVGDVIGIAFDVGTQVKFYKNNSLQGTVNVSSGTNWFPFLFQGSTNGSVAVNFGQRPFAYTPPSGFKSLCTQNLPAPAIYNGANHMAATTYTGTGSSLSISNSVNGASFQPDFVWFKSRSSTAYHALFDVVRGRANGLSSNTTDAELTSVNAGDNLVSFNANGFTVGSVATSPYWNSVNGSALSLVAWQWKAGGTAVTNTSGTIISQVSANTTAGFSVVTYTGNGTNPGATIGHGLGVTPSMIITKSRSATGEWPSYHVSIGVTNTLYLNATYAATTYVNRFSAVSSTTFTTGSNGSELNTNGTTYVAYCFAAISGYSAFGSYTGNGSADGPFVYCGFRPRFVLIKNASTAPHNWFVYDTARDTYNAMNDVLLPNSSTAEIAPYPIDILSNGFKIRSVNTNVNSNGDTYIYAAFCESPFQNSLAR